MLLAEGRWRHVWWLLPAAFALHALMFWGRGVIDKEGVFFITTYLGQRPWLPMIFDPAVNDFGAYQGRELSYAADYVNARVFAWLYARGWLLFIAASSVVGLAAMAIGAAVVLRRRWRLDTATSAAVLTLFLSSIVVQASTGIYYRSAKVLQLVFVLALSAQVIRLLSEQAGGVGRWRWVALYGTAVLMPLVDRQGVFLLLWVAAVVAVWFAVSRPATRPAWRVLAGIAGIAVGAAATGEAYNRLVGPWLIQSFNGYAPDFSFQRLDIWHAVQDARFWRDGRTMMARQADFFFGGWGLAIASAAAVVLRLRHLLAQPVRAAVRDLLRDAIVVAAAWAGLILLAALMILRHPFVLTSPDHPYWYFFLPVHGVFLVGVAIFVRWLSPQTPRWQIARLAILLVLAAGNVTRWREQRHVMLASGYFISEFEKSQQMLEGAARVRQAAPQADPLQVPRFASPGPFGVVLRLPAPPLQLFSDTLDLARAVRAGQAPTARSGGFNWQAVRDFLASDGSPLREDDQLPALLGAFRDNGVVELRVATDPAVASALTDRLRALAPSLSSHILQAREHNGVTSYTLAPLPAVTPRAPAPATQVPIDARSITTSASASTDDLAAMLDRNGATRWTTGRAQHGQEWLRLAFPRPIDVARLRLELTRRTYTDYPRGLVIESELDGQRIPLFSGSALPAIVRGLLCEPFRAPAEWDFAPNTSDALVIRQTGATKVWYWSVHELAVWTR